MTDIDKLESLERRIAALEEMLTHQAHALDEVSEQLHLAEQARETLAGKQKALLERVQEVEDTGRDRGASLQDARPPHY
ncbi:SlyX family protein [Alphaproteobacteria bacterium]|nr:SlyX family protein [Alphaproteobacteria bacterium]